MTITDSKIRATVWWGPGMRRWYVDVYYAARRTPGTDLAERAAYDRASDSELITRVFGDRVAALDYAHFMVRLMRGAAALAVAGTAGAVSGAEFLKSLDALAPDDQEDDCDA